jgi:Ca2+-binding RTX toxin-like protein
MAITLSGAIGVSPYTLDYDSSSIAYQAAQNLIAMIDGEYSTAVIYEPHKMMVHAGALIIGDAVASNRIYATGFSAVIDENNGVTSTVIGGGDQTVLGGDGGLTYRSTYGNVTIDLGGGNNDIVLRGDTGTGVIYIGGGNNTIVAGDGATTIDAGAGNNREILGAGQDVVTITGHDTVFLGSGSATISAIDGGSVLIHGASSVSGTGYSLTFINGDAASTVQGAAGSYSIFGGAGGGVFHGGLGGDNFIMGGTGNTTLLGGGAGDTLLGGTGDNLIIAGTGNETLGGAGSTTFEFLQAHVHTAAGTVDSIVDFGGQDLFALSGGQSAIQYALQTYTVSGGNGSFLLQDGTKIVLDGYTGNLTVNNFKH